MTHWRDLPAGRELDEIVAERVLGDHVQVYDWRGSGDMARVTNAYSKEPSHTAEVLDWIEQQGWSWEIAYRWGFGYRASATMQQGPPFEFTHVVDCPSWPVAVCRVALALVEGRSG